MAWTTYQQKRLAIEKQLIDVYFPDFELSSPTISTSWEGLMLTNGNNFYKIRIEIPTRYPDVHPLAYIVEPSPLLTYNGNKLIDHGTSHAMHTFEPKGEWVQMCLYNSVAWTPECTVVKCLKKARLWIEAYDKHLLTGTKMSELVGTL